MSVVYCVSSTNAEAACYNNTMPDLLSIMNIPKNANYDGSTLLVHVWAVHSKKISLSSDSQWKVGFFSVNRLYARVTGVHGAMLPHPVQGP